MHGDANVRPWEFWAMTASEISLTLAKHPPPVRGQVASDAEVEEYARWYAGLTPREKVALAREGRL